MSFIQQLEQAKKEIAKILNDTRKGKSVDKLAVGKETDDLLGFQARYQARLTSKVTAQKQEFRQKIIEDLESWLHTIIAFSEFAKARGITVAAKLNEQQAVDLYNQRTLALEFFLNSITAFRTPFTPDEKIELKESRVINEFKGRSEREIFQVLSRTVPIDDALDEDITTAIMQLIKGAHVEPTIQKLVTNQNILLSPDNYESFRELGGSQGLRDYIAPYLAALVKKALTDEGVEAFNEEFRNTYFAVVNRVIKYYQEWEPTNEAERQKAVGNSTQKESIPSPSTGNEPQTSEIPTTAELVKDSQAIPVNAKKSPQKRPVKGTGLE